MSANECLNLTSCQSLARTRGMRADEPATGEDERFPLRVGRATWRVTRQEAASAMLQRRGAAQTLAERPLPTIVNELREAIAQLSARLLALEPGYIAPDAATLHPYHVYRPSRPELRARGYPASALAHPTIRQHQRQFTYLKLMASEPVFAPAVRTPEGPPTVRTIHLSRAEDARSLEGQRGIERRNTIHRAERLLRQAQGLMEQATEGLATLEPASLNLEA